MSFSTFRPLALSLSVAVLLGACASAPRPVAAAAAAAQVADGSTARVAILETTDVHSNILSYDYYKQREDDSLGYFATRRDKSVVFSPDRRAAVLFRVVGSVSVAGADPVGDRESWAAAVDAWLLNCREHGVHAVVLAAGEARAQADAEAAQKQQERQKEIAALKKQSAENQARIAELEKQLQR